MYIKLFKAVARWGQEASCPRRRRRGGGRQKPCLHFIHDWSFIMTIAKKVIIANNCTSFLLYKCTSFLLYNHLGLYYNHLYCASFLIYNLLKGREKPDKQKIITSFQIVSGGGRKIDTFPRAPYRPTLAMAL